MAFQSFHVCPGIEEPCANSETQTQQREDSKLSFLVGLRALCEKEVKLRESSKQACCLQGVSSDTVPFCKDVVEYFFLSLKKIKNKKFFWWLFFAPDI